jgi:hypothetical protein
MIDINKIGEEVAALIRGAEKDKEKIAPMLREVWAALDEKKEVNGVTTKSAWAKKFGITLRYCQYIVKDGSRKRSEKDDANRVRPLALLKELLTCIADEGKTKDALSNIRVKAMEICGEVLDWHPPIWQEELDDEKEAERQEREVLEGRKTVTHIRFSDRRTVCEKIYVNRPLLKDRVFKKDGEEATCPDCIKANELPKPKKKKVKRYSTNVHPGFITMPGKPHKTHKMQPDGKRTWCGKTPGETLAADARMVDDPTCRGCRTGEGNRKLHEEYKKSQVTEMHPEEQHTGQHQNCKECMKRHIPTDARREQSALFNATGNLDGDDEDVDESEDVPANIAPEVRAAIARHKSCIAVGNDPITGDLLDSDDEDETEGFEYAAKLGKEIE